MAIFYWNKYFEVGVPPIDRQHRRLVDLINELAEAFASGKKLPDVRRLIAELQGYASTHFHDEERLMAASALPEPEKQRHQQEHQGFINKLLEIESRTDLLSEEAETRILEFLTVWLLSHILGSDKKLFGATAAEGAGPVLPDFLPEISPVAHTLLHALTESEHRFRLISDHSPALMWVSGADGERSFFNHAWAVLLGCEVDALYERWGSFLRPEDKTAYFQLLQTLSADPRPTSTEYRLQNRNGDYRWFYESISPRLGPNSEFLGLLASATDITSIKEAEFLLSKANQELEKTVAKRTAQLEKMALTDTLTGIGNRQYLLNALDEELGRAQRYQRPLAMIFVDIDFFKRVNDTYGHDVGDIVLSGVSGCLVGMLREIDRVARFGGEEFVVLLPETNLEHAMAAAERMRRAVENLKIEDINEAVTVSAGVAQWTPGESQAELIRRCDQALYQAKHDGRNCCRSAEPKLEVTHS